MLKIENLDSYYGESKVIDNLSLQAKKGDITCLIGRNGVGKSTTLKSIMGLVKPRHGTIEFCGERLDGLSGWDVVKKGVIYIPEGREVFPDMTVLENLEMGAYSKKYSVKELRKKLEHAYELFPRLKERQKQKAGSLSGGEQQMLAIARGLMSDPKLLMCDEPSLGLAPVIVDEMFDTIVRVNQEWKIPVVVVEQNAYMALTISKHAFVLENGRIVQSGESGELISSPEIKKAYLGG